MMFPYRYGHMGGWGFGFGWIFPVLFWVLIIILIISLIHKHSDSGKESEPQSLEILKQRYAKGEITKKEFEEMKKDVS
jgi:putative membrane protein